jgi:hypothetical protein
VDDDGRDKVVLGVVALCLALVIIGLVMLVRGH